jgi:threonine/homoserine/homoserine lactone efflux protein
VSDLATYLVAGVAGLVSGLVSAVPVGPINVTIINEAARHGQRRAWLVGLGAGTMEMIFCGIGFAGFTGLFDSRLVQTVFQLVGFVVITLLGWHYLTTRTLPGFGRTEAAVRRRFHPHTAFLIGFVRVLGNPGVLLYWVAVAASFAAHGLVGSDGSGRLACLAGVAVATFGWFGLLAWLAAQVHGRISLGWLLRLSRISGVCLLVVAAVLGGRLIWLLFRG